MLQGVCRQIWMYRMLPACPACHKREGEDGRMEAIGVSAADIYLPYLNEQY